MDHFLMVSSVCEEVGRGRFVIGSQLHRAQFPMSVLWYLICAKKYWTPLPIVPHTYMRMHTHTHTYTYTHIQVSVCLASASVHMEGVVLPLQDEVLAFP